MQVFSGIIHIAVLLLCLFWGPGAAAGQGQESRERQSLETLHTVILYGSDDELAAFAGNIDFGPDLRRGFFSRPRARDLHETARNKVDALFRRVQEILDMSGKMKKITIHCFADRQALDAAFTAIYGRENQVRAWYRYKNNAIYLNVKDLHEGMLAHEMAHAIINHYLVIKPPSATAEILARYVATHLKH